MLSAQSATSPGLTLKVPVLEADGKRLAESLAISRFLDNRVPQPSLFNTKCKAGDVGVEFIHSWADKVMAYAIFPIVLPELVSHLSPEDQQYFRQSREKKFGKTLEEYAGDDTAKAVGTFRAAMEPVRQTVKQHKYLGGDTISYADIAVAGNLLWCKSISKVQLLAEDDPVYQWRERIFEHFHDTISKAQTYPV